MSEITAIKLHERKKKHALGFENSACWESGKINIKVKKGSGKTQEGIQDIKANKHS